MDRNTACAIIGSPTKNKKVNKQTRTKRSSNIFSKFHSENPSLKPGNSSIKINKISTALQTITQVCDGSKTVTPASAQKSLNSLKSMGLDKYILPPAPVVEAAAQVNSANALLPANSPSTNVVNTAAKAVANVVNVTTPPEAPITQVNQAIVKANNALNTAKESVTLINIEKKLQNAINALQTYKNSQKGGRRKTNRRKH